MWRRLAAILVGSAIYGFAVGAMHSFWLAGWNVKDPSQVSLELDIDRKKTGEPIVADPTNPLVIGSGDHAFAFLARKLRNLGVRVIVVSIRRALSRTQRDCASEVRCLDLVGDGKGSNHPWRSWN